MDTPSGFVVLASGHPKMDGPGRHGCAEQSLRKWVVAVTGNIQNIVGIPGEEVKRACSPRQPLVNPLGKLQASLSLLEHGW